MTVCVRERMCRSVELNSNLNLRLTKARENRVLKENQWDCNWQMEEVLQILEKDKKKKLYKFWSQNKGNVFDKTGRRGYW